MLVGTKVKFNIPDNSSTLGKLILGILGRWGRWGSCGSLGGPSGRETSMHLGGGLAGRTHEWAGCWVELPAALHDPAWWLPAASQLVTNCGFTK